MRGDEDTVETDASGKVLVGVGAALAASFITTLSSRFNCGVFWHWFCTLLMYSRSSSLLVSPLQKSHLALIILFPPRAFYDTFLDALSPFV